MGWSKFGDNELAWVDVRFFNSQQVLRLLLTLEKFKR